MTAICAICTLETSEWTLEPLGRNGASVRVCAKCSTEVPDTTFGPQRAYEGNGPTITANDARNSRYVRGRSLTAGRISHRTRSGGTSRNLGELFRVPQMVCGRSRSFEEAQAFAMRQPWWKGDVTYYGKTAKYYLWTRSPVMAEERK